MLQLSVSSPKTRVQKNLSTHTMESISSPEGLQKAREWAQSHVIVSYDKCGSLGDVCVIAKHAVCAYVAMLVYSRFG